MHVCQTNIRKLLYFGTKIEIREFYCTLIINEKVSFNIIL